MLLSRLTLTTLAMGTILVPGWLSVAAAVEPARAAFGLWEFQNDRFPPSRLIAGVDFFPDEGGIEMLGLTDSLMTTAPNNAGNVRTVAKSLVHVRNADTGDLVAEYSATTDSGFYPDPFGSTGQTTTYYCGFSGDVVNPTQEEFPCEELFGFGAANVGSTRLFIVGNSLTGAYSNAGDGFVDVSRFRVQSFNLRNGNLRWSRTFRLTDSAGFELEPVLSAVADFLNEDGDDEVRIVQVRELPNGNDEFRYRYYDAKFGTPLKTMTFTMPQP